MYLNLKGRWGCWKCKIWCEVAGVGALAAFMVPDPEASIAISAMKATYLLVTKHYGRAINEEDFIRRTQSLIGELNDLEFLAAYPGRICNWFGKCS